MALDLKNDIIFKEFFSRKENEKFLKDFLNALLKIEIGDIKIKRDVTLERLGTEEKLGTLDIQAEVNGDIIVSIEMQNEIYKYMTRRMGFYGAKQLSSDVAKGTQYAEYKPIIAITILNYNLNILKEYEGYISKGITVIEEHRECEIDTGLKYYFIELPKFRKQNINIDDKLSQWLVFIDNRDRGLIEMAKEKNEIIKEAEEELNYLTGEEAEKRMAFLHEKWEMDEISFKAAAREERLRGTAWKNGRIEGERKKQIEIAKEMLKENMDIATIAKITKLTKEEIEKL